jgi:hypothetical protein
MKLSQGKYKHFHNKDKKLMGYNTKALILIESQKVSNWTLDGKLRKCVLVTFALKQVEK